jgi:3-oxoacyl-[acyl-carrier protein] reductase
MQLEGKVGIVTGGGKGIGKVYCQALFREGASLVVADIDQDAANDTAQQIDSEKERALAVTVDVSDATSVKEMVRAALKAFGHIDILVNNAAVFADLHHRPFWEIEEQEWEQVMAVNVKGVYFCVREVLPTMREQGYGKIVNISSGTVFKGTPGLLHYVSSKAAIVGMSRSLSRELG